MTFLSTGLLAGLLATAFPVLLHLLAKQQPKRIVFPATRFLKPSLDTQRERIKIRRWWLMAMRILAIALLAVALARPQIATTVADAWFMLGASYLSGFALLGLATAALIGRQSRALQYSLAVAGLVVLLASSLYAGYLSVQAPAASATDQSPAAVAIIIDNSIRSSVRLPGAATEADAASSPSAAAALEQMKTLATQYLDDQTADSLIAVIDRSPRPATFSLDRAAAVNRIAQLQPQALTEPLVDRIRAAVALVRSSNLERRTVLLLTDLTAASFVESQFKSADLAALLSQEPALLLQVLDVGQDTAANWSIDKVSISDLTPPRLAKTDVAITLTQPSSATSPTSTDRSPSASTLSVELAFYSTQDDGSRGLPVLRDSRVVLPPQRVVDRVSVSADKRQAETLLTIPPLEFGTHHGQIRIMVDDDFTADNVHYFTLAVQEPKRVLLLGADADERTLLGNAITAPLSVTDPSAEFRLDLAEFLPSSADELANYDLLIWIDPAVPTPPQMNDLDRYVASGGNVIWMLGPALAASDLEPRFGEGLERIWRAPEPGDFFEVIRPSHPAVRSLRDVVGGVPWNAFRVHRYWQINPTDDDTVIARFAGSGHPALIERTIVPSADNATNRQAGTKLIVTTPLPALAGESRAWNELFSGSDAWPAFLLLRDLVNAAVYRDRSSSNLTVGDNAVAGLPLTAAASSASNSTAATADSSLPSESKGQLFPPAGLPLPVTLAADGKLVVPRLDQAGTYWLKSVAGVTGFSVNQDPTQLPLQRIDRSRLDEYLGPENYGYARTLADVQSAEGTSQPTRPLYSVLLMLMLLAFALEQMISNRFYATRTTLSPSHR